MGSGTLLNKIYTETYITEGQSKEVNTHHEVRQLEMTSKKNVQGTQFKCHQIFNILSDKQKRIRVVAVIGKTVSVKSSVWTGKRVWRTSTSVPLVLLSFRELNVIKDKQFSLLTLLHIFHPTLEKIRAEARRPENLCSSDGLDGSRLSLEFTNKDVMSDVTQVSSVGVLLMKLIQGNLLPAALIQITSQPAAAHQIPPSCVDRVTDVGGFTHTRRRRSASGGGAAQAAGFTSEAAKS